MQLLIDQAPTQIDTDSGEAGPQVTALANGGYVVVWDNAHLELHQQPRYKLYVDVFDPSGALLKSTVIDGGPANNVGPVTPMAQVAALDDGGFAIAWHRSTVSPAGSAAQTFDALGNATSAIISVTGSIYGQSMAPLANGSFALGWSQLSPSGVKDAYAATFDSSGQVSATTQLSHLAGSAYVDSPVLVSLPNGYAVSWTAALNALTANIYTAIFDLNGQMIGAPIEVSGPFNTSIHTELKAEPLSNGSYVLSWSRGAGGDAVTDVYSAIYGANGAQIAPPAIVAHGKTAHVADLADGSHVIVTNDSGIAFQINDLNGHAVTGKIAVTHDDAYSVVRNDLAVTASADGDQFLVSWTQTTREAPYSRFGSADELFVAVYDSTGHRVTEAVNLSDTQLNAESTPAVAALADDHFLVSWSTGRFASGVSSAYYAGGIYTTIVAPGALSIGPVDLNGDGRSDMLMRNHEGDIGSYQVVGGQYQWTALAQAKMTYSVAGVGDFDGDHKSDLLLRNNVTGDLNFYSAGSTLRTIGASSNSYAVVATGDFDRDGTSDILFRDAAGDMGFYRMSAGATTGWGHLGPSSTDYTVVGVGDLDGDGGDDILFRNMTAGGQGALGFYHLQNGALTSWGSIATSSTAYTVVGVADFDGNGSADILFRNDTTGDTGFYKIDHGHFVDWVNVQSSSPDYRVVNVGDFDNNGSVDILFENEFTHDLGYYALDHGHFLHWIGVATTADGFFGI
jgi:hypothetical protein